MKKNYTTPIAEKIEFDYKEQLVASGASCTNQWMNTGDNTCDKFEWVSNFNS